MTWMLKNIQFGGNNSVERIVHRKIVRKTFLTGPLGESKTEWDQIPLTKNEDFYI
jgi:hypothetical protein